MESAQEIPANSFKSSKKLSKLKMEKKRRARINSSLNELRTILLDARRLDEFQVARMEKAEILEATVQHLKDHGLRKSQATADQRLAGYNACAKEIQRRLSTTDDHSIDDSLRVRLLSYMYNRCATIVQSRTGPSSELSVAGKDTLNSADSSSGSQTLQSSVPVTNHNAPFVLLSAPSTSNVSGFVWNTHAQSVTQNHDQDIWRPW